MQLLSRFAFPLASTKRVGYKAVGIYHQDQRDDYPTGVAHQHRFSESGTDLHNVHELSVE